MSVFDLIILIFVVLAAWNGWRSGLVKQAVSLVGVLLAYVIARTFYTSLLPVVNKYVKLPVTSTPKSLHAFLNGQLQIGIAFLVLFVLSFLAIKIVGVLLDSVAKLPGLSFLNQVSGLALGGLLAIFIAALVINVMHLFPNATVQQALRSSQIAQFLIQKFAGVMPHPTNL